MPSGKATPALRGAILDFGWVFGVVEGPLPCLHQGLCWSIAVRANGGANRTPSLAGRQLIVDLGASSWHHYAARFSVEYSACLIGTVLLE